MHPDTGNQGWILLNMARTHREGNLILSPRIRDHSKMAHIPAEKLPAAAEAANATPLSTKSGYNTSEVLLQLFYPTETNYSDLTGTFPVQSDRGNNYILVA